MALLRTSLVLLTAAPLVLLTAEAKAQTQVDLQTAIDRGLVSVNVSSLGGAVGNTMRVTVQRRVPEELQIVVSPGTVFVSVSGKVQALAASTIKGEFLNARTYRPGSVMVLVDNQAHAFLVETFCMEYHKPAPATGQVYQVAKADPRATRILVGPKDASASIWAYQAAIWMDRSGVSTEELKRRYHIADVDLQAALGLLKSAEQAGKASIRADVPADVRVHLEAVFSSDPAVRAEAAKALRQIPGLAAIVEVNAPALPDVPENLAEAANTLEALAPPSLQDLIAEQAGTVIDNVMDLAADPPGGPLSKLPLLGLAKPRLEASLGLLRSPLPAIRTIGARRLGMIREPRAVDALIGALKDSEPKVQEAAAESLRKLTNQNLGTDPDVWQKWWEGVGKEFPDTPAAAEKPEPSMPPETGAAPPALAPPGPALPPPGGN